MSKTVFDVLLEKHEEDVASSTQFLASGGVTSFEQYKEVVGRIRGLQLAIQTVKDLQQRQIGNDDD
jgi:hypothetical protein